MNIYSNGCKETHTKLFRYGFDLRILGLMLPTDPIFIEDMPYYLQPDDAVRIKKQWELINEKTSQSIRFKQNLEFAKGMCRDRKNKQ